MRAPGYVDFASHQGKYYYCVYQTWNHHILNSPITSTGCLRRPTAGSF